MKELINKVVRGKFSLVFLILFVIALYYILNKGVMPVVMSVLKSDVLFEEEVEHEELGKIDTKTPRMGYALTNCKEAVKKEGDIPETAQFLDDGYEAWALGNRHYVIRSSVRVSDPDKGIQERLYACKLRMIADNESDPASWSILGVDFNEPSDDTAKDDSAK